jgi:hypothetical protein
MDYKLKYLKYKFKYLHLKEDYKFNLKGGSNLESSYNFITELKKLYPASKHDNISLHNKYNGHKITYGEMDYDGFDDVIKYLSFTNSISFDCFIDIGSGRGKICIYASSLPSIKQSIGIELVKERHDDAIELKSKLKDYSEVLKVNLINDNIFNYDFKQLNSSKTLIWLSNLIFEQKTTDDIFRKILNESQNETFIICSRQHTLNDNRIKEINKIKVKMSWDNNSLVHCYKIN